MPVTKTAKRALRGSERKQSVNKVISSNLEKALRVAKKSKAVKDIQKATSLADIAAKKKLIHSNKAGRIKQALSKLIAPKAPKKAKAKK